MAFPTDEIELAESWNYVETADGEQIERIFYVPYAKIFGGRGGSGQVPAMGDVLIDKNGVRYEQFRVIRIVTNLNKEDLKGARTSIFYSTAASTTVRQAEADLRTSWRSRFYSSMEVIEVNNKFNAGVYTGDALDNPAIVYIPRFTYELTIYASEHNIDLYSDKVGLVNNSDFFREHRKIVTSDPKIAESIELENIYSINDTGKWIFMDLAVNKIAHHNHEISFQFVFNKYQWNPDGVEGVSAGSDLYESTDFKVLTASAKKLQLPSTTPTRA